MTFCGVFLEERLQGYTDDYFPLEVCGLWQLSLADCHLHMLIRTKCTGLAIGHTGKKPKHSMTLCLFKTTLNELILPADWTRVHSLSMLVCRRSKMQTLQATAPLLNCILSCSCSVSSSSLLLSRMARKAFALSLRGGRGRGATRKKKIIYININFMKWSI